MLITNSRSMSSFRSMGNFGSGGRFGIMGCRVPCCLVGCWVALIVSLALPHSLPAVEHAALAGALESIRTTEIQRHVDVLADDSFEGREAGSRGGHAAANYLASLMETYDLLPAGESESYFQGFGANYRNVLGLLEGSDPRLKGEVILVGAHYDHVGYGNASNSNGPIGQIHNGADDNASGVAGVLSLAAALQNLPTPPRRSILFAFWDGEEKGLLGSQHWTREPTIPVQQVVMALNVDMIGRLREGRVEVYGTRTTTGLREALARANQDPEVWFDFNWEMKNNSDHYSFYERSIPSMMLHTGLHDQYHRPSDEAHTINAEGLRQITTIMLRLVVDLADRESLASTALGDHVGVFQQFQMRGEVAGLARPADRMQACGRGLVHLMGERDALHRLMAWDQTCRRAGDLRALTRWRRGRLRAHVRIQRRGGRPQHHQAR